MKAESHLSAAASRAERLDHEQVGVDPSLMEAAQGEALRYLIYHCSAALVAAVRDLEDAIRSK